MARYKQTNARSKYERKKIFLASTSVVAAPAAVPACVCVYICVFVSFVSVHCICLARAQLINELQRYAARVCLWGEMKFSHCLAATSDHKRATLIAAYSSTHTHKQRHAYTQIYTCIYIHIHTWNTHTETIFVAVDVIKWLAINKSRRHFPLAAEVVLSLCMCVVCVCVQVCVRPINTRSIENWNGTDLIWFELRPTCCSFTRQQQLEQSLLQLERILRFFSILAVAANSPCIHFRFN